VQHARAGGCDADHRHRRRWAVRRRAVATLFRVARRNCPMGLALTRRKEKMLASPASFATNDASAERLASAAATGVPLEELFLALADDADNRRVRRASQQLAARLAAGDDLPAAVAAASGAMPRAFRGP